MKKVININFQGQVIAIEETAYEILKQYIESLKNYFSREEGGDEIVNDIENRIAELFGKRLKLGINCITDEDVESIINSIGRPEDFDTEYEEKLEAEAKTTFNAASDNTHSDSKDKSRSLFRNSNDKIIGGVCSGVAHYFKTDPTWIRLIFVLFFGILFWVYIILWIVLKPQPLESNVTKRLYRNPNDRYIGGVCGGIAAFFKIDSWIPRLLFLLPLFINVFGMISIFPLSHLFRGVDFNWNINGSVVLFYLVLWIIVPEAKTVKQKLEMMGEDEYIKTIRDKVTDNVASSKIRAEAENVSSTQMPPDPPRSDMRFSETTKSERSGCVNALLVLLKIVFFTFAGIFGLALLALFGGLFFAGTQLIPLKSLFIDPGYESNLMIASLVALTVVPVIAIIIWIIRRVMKAKSRPVIGVIASVLWFSGIVICGILAKEVADKFKTEASEEVTMVMDPSTSGKLYIEMEPYRNDYAEFKFGFGYNPEIEELPFTNVNEDSLLFNSINLQIRQSSDSLFHIRTIAATNGRDLREAKKDAEQFTYDIVQRDSVILLPEFFSVPVEQGFRNQSVTVEVSVPAGKSVEVSDVLDNYRDNEPPAVARKRIRSYTSSYTPVTL
ncbi:MAG: PspC domain-containing protein [Fermentimonas sp.]|nr:PspC domain-containing protein [Fermentimonas sp.]